MNWLPAHASASDARRPHGSTVRPRLAAIAIACCALFGCDGGPVNSGVPTDATGEPDGAVGETTSDATGAGEPNAKGWTTLTDKYADGALLSVYADTTSSAWIVGGEAEKPVVLRFADGQWSRLDPPVQQQLWWVHGFSDGARVVVGESGTIAMYAEATWTTHDSTAPGSTLFGVWGTQRADIWAVGGPWQRAPAGMQTERHLLLHHDGKTWQRVDVSKLVHEQTQSLFKVWGADADNVFVVGDQGTVLRYDGKAWMSEPTGLVGVVLFTVHGTSADDVWAVGGFGSPVLVHRGKAGKWAQVDTGDWAPTLQGVRASGDGSVWVSGWNGYAARLSAGVWQEFAVGDQALHAITDNGAGGVWAVGGDITTLKSDHLGAIVSRGLQASPP